MPVCRNVARHGISVGLQCQGACSEAVWAMTMDIGNEPGIGPRTLRLAAEAALKRLVGENVFAVVIAVCGHAYMRT